MARPFPWNCRVCGEKQVYQVGEDYKTTLEHDGREYPVTLPDLCCYKCRACGARTLPDEAHRRLAMALRHAAGLLLPPDIRKNRESLGLTQRQLAQFLNVAETTVCRWETGTQIQQRAMDLLLRAYFDVPEFREYLNVFHGRSARPATRAVTIVTEEPSLDSVPNIEFSIQAKFGITTRTNPT